jgi:hypothetical protein
MSVYTSILPDIFIEKSLQYIYSNDLVRSNVYV